MRQLIKSNQKNLTTIQKAFIDSAIYPRIVFLGSHGSAIYKSVRKNSESDYDLEIILDTPKSGDLEKIKKILDHIDLKIECQLRYVNEITETGLISKTKYKLFMYIVYANGITLIGQNIYSELVDSIKAADIKDSLALSAQIAFKDIRKAYLSGKSPYEVNKQISRFFVCHLLSKGHISSKSLGTRAFFNLVDSTRIYDFFMRIYRKILTGEEVRTIKGFKLNCRRKKIDAEMIQFTTKFAQNIGR